MLLSLYFRSNCTKFEEKKITKTKHWHGIHYLYRFKSELFLSVDCIIFVRYDKLLAFKSCLREKKTTHLPQ